MLKSLRLGLSHLVGWLADRRVPRALRPLVYGGYCRFTGADPTEARLGLAEYPSLGAFFVRSLAPDRRPLAPEGQLISPCDGRIQSAQEIHGDSVLQAKGQPYSLGELLAGSAEGVELDGGFAWTIYLSPQDYHRVHCPVDARLTRVDWVPGDRYSVAPGVLLKTPRVFARNERAVLRLEDERGPVFLVMVGALNVGRIRVVGVEQGASPAEGRAPSFARGDELARFEMGSTVVLVFPPGRVEPGLREPETPLRLGEALGRWLPAGSPAE